MIELSPYLERRTKPKKERNNDTRISLVKTV